MQASDPGSASPRPLVLTVPSSDVAFREHVVRVSASAPDARSLERRLRRIFPLVVVRDRVLSGQPGWYVYRDGAWRPPDTAWWEEPSLPRVEVSPDGWLRHANATAAGLLEIDPDDPAQHHFTDFVVPGALEDSVALFRAIESGHTLDATIRMRPRSGAVIAVELHARRDGDGIIGVFRLASGTEHAVDEVQVPRPATVTTVPASDPAFRAYVLRALEVMPEPTPDGLAMRVRRLYPHATTATDGDRWMVRRDGAEEPDGTTVAWWDDPTLPRVRYDADALILDADPAAEALFGRSLVGHHWQDLVLPGTSDEVAVMLEILGRTGAAASRFRMPRGDGTLLEFDSYTTLDGEDLVTVMRPARPR